MKKKLYYHLYCAENPLSWMNVIFEQMGLIQSSGLMNELDEIKMTCIVYNDVQFNQVVKIMSTYDVNTQIEKVINPFKSDDEMMKGLYTNKGVNEDYTHHKIYADASQTYEDYAICYVQSKGVIQYLKNDLLELKKYYYWRNYLNWGNIVNWKKCVSFLNDYDVVGVDYQTQPVPHFRGTMFWTKSSHIRTLSDPQTDDWWIQLKKKTDDTWLKNCATRFKAEMWALNKSDIKVYNLHVAEENPAISSYINYN